MRHVQTVSRTFIIGLIFITLFSSCQKKTEAELEFSGAYQALNNWSHQRAYPGEVIPDVGHYKAFEASKKLSKSAKVESAEGWETMGPHNMGGRTLAIAFNPQNPKTIYAGSASGGLWRSYSGGVGAEAWEYVSTGFPVLGVSSIAIAPEDSNTMYIGTGEVYRYQAVGTGAASRATRGTYGIGVLKTTDGGVTWEKSLDWSYNQRRGVWAVKVNPQNPNSVWAATTEGTFRSYDAGTTWTQIHDVVMNMDLAFHQADTNIVIATYGNFASPGHGIYRSTDGGSSWEKAALGDADSFRGKALLATSKDFPDIVLASVGNGFGYGDAYTWLCMTVDAGATWGIVNEKDYSKWQGWFAHDVAIDPTNFANVIAVGIDVYKSTYGGSSLEQKTSWQLWYGGQLEPGQPEGPSNFSHADHHDVVYHPTDPNIIYLGNDGGVFRSLDGGETFEGCNGGYQTVQFYNGFSCSQQDSLLAIGGLQDNGTMVYRGTTAWDRIVIGGDGCCTGIDYTDDKIMYGSWQNLNIARSTNRGRSFSGIQSPGSGRLSSFVAPFVLGIPNPLVMYAGKDIVYKSENRGSNWQATNNGLPLDGNPVLSMAASYQSEDVVYAATAPLTGIRSGVFRTTDGGDSWSNVTRNLPDRFPTDLAVDPNDDKKVFVTFSGYESSHVFKSTNGGDSWQDISAGLPDLPTNAVVVDPSYPDAIYVGNDLGVYVTLDGGAHWHEFSEELPDAVIAMDLVVSPSNRKLRLATHGNGAYERDLLDVASSVDNETAASPNDYQLMQNYPNPFNGNTVIPFRLDKAGNVKLAVYNSAGQKVAQLLSEEKPAGQYETSWNGRSASGEQVSTGTYFYRLTVDDFTTTRGMVYVK